MVYLLLGCLFDRATYEARLAALTDDDGDGLSEVGGDCDDAEADVFPQAAERCNERDDDCDGVVDETEDLEGAAWYVDADGDGFGGGDSILTCDAAAMGLVTEGGDCQDHDAAVFPGAAERCNEADDDCDGQIDDPAEVETRAWFADRDDDGFGTGDPIASCPDPGGASLTDGDCDDGDPEVSPAATETCNGQDDDCNGATDDAPAITWYLDRDEDGFGDDAVTYLVCTPPPGYADEGGDCDDLDADRHPGAWDECEDGADGDCDGLDTTCGIPTGEADVDDVSARFTGDAGEAYVARTVASAGDLDGDGDDELVVARGGWDDYTGKVHLVPGDPELYLGEVELDSVGAVVEGDEAYGAFGFALGTGEDVDGDGTADVAVVGYGSDEVALFRGGPGFLTGTLDEGDAWATYTSNAGTGTFGISLALVGDLDADGWGEALVADYTVDSGAEGAGEVYLFYGDGAGGQKSAADAVTFGGDTLRQHLGKPVAAANDLDGDGQRDLVMTANFDGVDDDYERAYLFLGPGRLHGALSPDDADVIFTSDATDQAAFDVVVAAPDIDGDGRIDLVTAVSTHASGSGRIDVIAGANTLSSGGLSDVSALTIVGESGSDFSISAGPAGDLDGDGLTDLVGLTASGDSAGTAYVFFDPVARGSRGVADADLALAGAGCDSEGTAVVASLDLNGDEASDLVVTGRMGNAGEAWLLYGSP